MTTPVLIVAVVVVLLILLAVLWKPPDGKFRCLLKLLGLIHFEIESDRRRRGDDPPDT